MASVRKLDPKDPKSPWVVEYTDGTGKRRRETPKSGLKKDALAIKLRIENEIVGGRHIARSRALTVKEICERYLLHCEQRVADGRLTKGSWVGLDIAIRRTLVPALGTKLFVDLRRSDIEHLYDFGVRVGKLNPTIARQRVAILKRVQDFAIKRDLTKGRIVDEALQDFRGLKSPPIRRFTPDQVRLLLTEAGAYRRRCCVRMTDMGNVMVHLAALCGLRFGEITGLTIENVDFENGKLRIRHSMSDYDGHKGPKTSAGIRDVPMPERVAALLQDFIRRHYVDNELGLILTSRTGGPHSNANFHCRYWQPLMRRLGFVDGGERFHFHALRHFAASMLCKHIPLTDVPRLLGHRTLDTTLQIYAHEIAGPHARASALERIAAEMTTPPPA